MSNSGNNKSFRETHLNTFEPDISYENLLKRVKQEPCRAIAEELYYAHKRNALYKEQVAGLVDLAQMIIDAESADESLVPVMYQTWLNKAKTLKKGNSCRILK